MPNIEWMKSIKARLPEEILTGSDAHKWSAFNRDYAQIVHSDFFKRLAGKTQVHAFPINDHLRTRMTHSIEVSQIGRHIARYFALKLQTNSFLSKEESPDVSGKIEELTASACLIHDTGHPPFGHIGARLLNDLAKNFSEDFDDNKQVVRLILNNIWNEKFDPSGTLVVSVMKHFEPSKSSYKSELELLNKNIENLGLVDCRHPASLFMEAADDLAYIAADLSDYIRYFLDSSQFQDFCANDAIRDLSKIHKVDTDFNFEGKENLYSILNMCFDGGKRSDETVFDFSSNLIKSGLKVIFKNIDLFFESLERTNINEIPKKLRDFISNNSNNGDVNLLYLKCSIEGDVFFTLKKSAYKEHILEIPHVGSQNLLAKKIMNELFDHFKSVIHSDFRKSDIFKMLPMDCKGYLLAAHDQTNTTTTPARVIIDFISGMTDEYALRMWEVLSKPHILSRAA